MVNAGQMPDLRANDNDFFFLSRKDPVAAEQTIGAGLGSEKMKYVINEMWLRGIKVDTDMIEAAVKEMNDKALKVMGETLEVKDVMEVELGEDIEARQKDDGTLEIVRAETFGEASAEIEGE